MSDSELSIWLQSLVPRARQQDAAGEKLLAALAERESKTPAAWWQSADVCALAALAFAELGDFERAVDYYERVLKAERASAPILALEQLANCKVRWAGRLLEAEPADDKKVSELLKHAEKILRHLIDLGPTSERWALLGGLMKRRAIGAARDAKLRRKALEEMRDAYKNAYDLSRANGAGDAFPLGNQIAADLVLSWRDNGSPKKDDARAGVAASLKELRTIADGLSSSNTDFFSLVVVADQMLLQALMEGRLDDKTRDGILQKFKRALSRGITARQRDSVRTQFLFFRRLMQAGFPKEDRDRIVPQLEFLEEKLVPGTRSTERAMTCSNVDGSGPRRPPDRRAGCDGPAVPGGECPARAAAPAEAVGGDWSQRPRLLGRLRRRSHRPRPGGGVEPPPAHRPAVRGLAFQGDLRH